MALGPTNLSNATAGYRECLVRPRILRIQLALVQFVALQRIRVIQMFACNMKFDVLTLFPDIIYQYCNEAIIGRAQKNDLINVRAHNFRQFSGNKWGHVDDRPVGGGPGMILRVEPIYECLKSIGDLDLSSRAKQSEAERSRPTNRRDSSAALLRRSGRNDKIKVIVMDPAGKKFDQRMAEKLAQLDELVIVCGRYEGFDARVYDFVDERVSVGDFVLAGGELAALSIIEATSRLITGVLGNSESLVNETHNLKLIAHNTVSSKLQAASSEKEYPQYTKPVDFMGKKVPKVLLSGNHGEIEKWRKSKIS